ncbi:TPA: metal-sulfur cluster assembly factor [Enterococcus faecalis]|nr:metal-sulfur cluster assembly factor [Enterococcus faecalis]
MSEQPQQRSTEEVEAIKEDILTALETVIDPELGIDIVNLGLIYEVEFAEETGDTVIKMTLTTMGCPLADVLTEQIHGVLKDIPEVKLVWYPAWTTDKMSRYARIALGIR